MNIQKHRRNLLFVSLILSNFSFNLGTYIIIITPISFSKYFHVSSETVMSFTQIYGIISSVLSIPFSVLADAFNFYLPYRIASVAIFLGLGNGKHVGLEYLLPNFRTFFSNLVTNKNSTFKTLIFVTISSWILIENLVSPNNVSKN